MKSTVFKKILDQTTLEINVPYETMVQRLRAQEGACYEIDHLDYNFYFHCNKKGVFRINSSAPTSHPGNRSEAVYRSYYILGKVLSEQNKSKIHIYTVNDRGNKVYLLFDAFLGLLFMAFYLFTLSLAPELGSKRIYLFLMMLIFSCDGLFRLISDHNHKIPEMETMKEIALRKIEAAKRWNE